MPQNQVGNTEGFVDRTRANAGSAARGNNSVATPANYDNMDALDARLTAISALYTPARLNSMTWNDKIYAVRLADDAGTI